MYITIPKFKEGSIVRKYWTKVRPKANGQTPSSVSPCLIWKRSSDLQLLSVLLTITHFSFLGCLYSLLAALLISYAMTLASPTSWVLQGNPGFNFTASHNGLSRPPFRDNPDACLTSAAFLSSGDKFHNDFLLSLTLLLSVPGTWSLCSVTSSPAFCFW